MYDLSTIQYVTQIAFGDDDAIERSRKVDLLNRCLTDYPRGKIMEISKATSSHMVGEDVVATETVTYHIGFLRRPNWMAEQPQAD